MENGTSSTVSFLPVKKDIDITKLRNKEYALGDIVDTMPNEQVIGSIDDKKVVLKTGKFGLYALCDGTSVSITLEEGQTHNDIDISTVEGLIRSKREGTSTNSSIVRTINNQSSIRNGKYGQYIYYKTEKMTKPSFIKLQGFSGDYMSCPETELETWIQHSRSVTPIHAGTTSKTGDDFNRNKRKQTSSRGPQKNKKGN